ncbi:MAG: hypothetical protein SFV17_08555 [Candidatus Obscuribacter sp.]|nr:hypothetical protein [Candidatus Melainabacteria bacterium]MDX1986724.1 hypothetical protein [Candidatus Obscuribacter sp.]
MTSGTLTNQDSPVLPNREIAAVGFTASSLLFLVDLLALFALKLKLPELDCFMLVSGIMLSLIALYVARELQADLFREVEEHPGYLLDLTQLAALAAPIGIACACLHASAQSIPAFLGLFFLGFAAFVWPMCEMFYARISKRLLKDRSHMILKVR